jgi:hypothetical protein
LAQLPYCFSILRLKLNIFFEICANLGGGAHAPEPANRCCTKLAIFNRLQS